MKRILLLLLLCADAFAQGLAQKSDIHILYIGWGSPKLGALTPDNVAQYEEAAPFDGILVYVGTSDVMNPKVKYDYDRHARPQVEKYKSLPFKRYKHNFAACLIDQNKIDWFSDEAWSVISNNWAVTARAARECGMDGICFDPECYGVYPVTSYWSSKYYLKTDRTHLPADYLAAARRRGREIGAAVFGEYPSARLFSFYLWSFKSDLMGALCNGILDVMPDTGALIDGDEWNGYIAKNEDAYKAMAKHKEDGYGMLDRKHRQKQKKQGQLAVSFYLDEYVRYGKASGASALKLKQLFAKNLKSARRVSDGYIWIYGEKGTWWDFGAKPGQKTWDEQLPGFREVLFGRRP